jgi:hypothetical protein
MNTSTDRAGRSGASQPVRVLCIAGTGQSGTTLLTRMLGRLPGVVAAGEVGYLWDWGLVENRPCGCGLPFSDCPFWTRVGQEAFGGWDRVDPTSILALRKVVNNAGGRLPQPFALAPILMPRLSRSYQSSLRRYAEVTARVYEGISKAAGGAIVIDSMKRPTHVYMMSRHPGLKVNVVHMVRDSRGVAYSNVKWVQRQRPSQGPYRLRRRPAKTAARWMWIHLAFELLGRLDVPLVRVRYENLVRFPREEIRRLAEALEIPISEDDLKFIRGDVVDLAQDHIVAGGRMRMDAGSLPLRLDDQWRTHLSPQQIRAVSLISWPLLRRYDYPQYAAGRVEVGGGR